MRIMLSTTIAVVTFGVSLSAQGAIAGPCFEPNFGLNLNLTDDSLASGLPLGFAFPAPGGTTVTNIDVSSNGFVWLSSNNTDSGCCDGDETKFLTRGPRIAPLWVDLDPSSGGAVWFNSIAATATVPAHAVITWDDVPEFQGTPSLSFQLQLYDDGSVLMFYDPSVGVSNHSAITGITEGNGASPDYFDIPSSAQIPYDSSTNPTAYQQQYYFFAFPGTAWTWVPNGLGGYVVTQKAACPFASATTFGVGCPRPVTTYELFTTANPIDLSNTAIEFFPNGNGGYVGTPLAGFFTGYTNQLTLGDDESQGPFNLPFTFPYPGGTTNAIDICSNGFIWLQSGNSNPRCCDGDESLFSSDPASIAPLWIDLYPPGGGNVYFDTVGTTEAHITFVNVPEFLNQGSNTFQVTLRSDGSFRLSWGNVANLSHDAIVGISSGFGSSAPGSINLSAGTFVTGSGGIPLRLVAETGSRPQIGSTFTMDVDQITPGSLIGLMILGANAFPGGIDLTALGMPECNLYASLDTLLSFPLTGVPTPYPFAVPANQSLAGIIINAQAATVTPAANPLNLLASNGMTITIGL